MLHSMLHGSSTLISDARRVSKARHQGGGYMTEASKDDALQISSEHALAALSSRYKMTL